MHLDRTDEMVVIETGERYRHADRTETFTVPYKDKKYLFVQNLWDDHWAVNQGIGLGSVHGSNSTRVFEHLKDVGRVACLLDTAGFFPERMDDTHVMWVRDEEVPLWPS